MRKDNTEILRQLLKQRILVLDGAMGTAIQAHTLAEHDFRGERFADHPVDLLGNNDLLCLTRPELIGEIHRGYLAAGADIISTNTFNGTPISQADYQTADLAYEINAAAGKIARSVCDEFEAREPQKPRFVAGSMGPTNKTCSISPDVNNPGARNVTFDEMRDAYYEQARGLIDGGVDILLVETIFDTLNGKAAIFAIEQLFEERGVRLPIWISGTITDASGRTLSGQTTEAFWISIEHCRPLMVGLNCALGAETLRPYVEELSDKADTFVSIHPNAGLPNEFGGYDDTPEYMARVLRDFAQSGYLNIVGGCCGTTAEHIKAIAEAVAGITPRQVPKRKRLPRFAGLEPLTIRPDSLFVNIGERTNVAGSRKFARLITEGRFEEALEIAALQVESGAQMIDVNMDEGMLDSRQAMVTFLNLIASEPEISKVPIVIDSSKWEVLEAGLKCIQGKGVVNSISMKDGEEEFLRRARLVRRYGAAVIVMAFDEKGQADTYERKVEICRRAYELLTEKVGFPPEDVIFDPNIFAVATGIEEHNSYAVDYIRACKTIKSELPYASVSGGVSNLSFSFRGNNVVREAMHSVFLYHAIEAGMDMGIVNAGQLEIYDDIPRDLRDVVEDVILNRSDDATSRLLAKAEGVSGKSARKAKDLSWREEAPTERIKHALVHGIADHIEADVMESLEEFGDPLKVIEGPMMEGMNIVGDLFGAGKMFLPQVVKSARVMKKGVAVLEPLMAEEAARSGDGSKGVILMATVKGDVHDIGKNIVGVVLSCNGYKVIDLGVMVPADKLLQVAAEESVDIIGLSGLITPSLDEMVHVAREMERRKLTTPLLIGGATTSKIHTAVKIDPAYSGVCVHVTDASRAAPVIGNLLNREKRADYVKRVAEAHEAMRLQHEQKQNDKKLLTIAEARANKTPIEWGRYTPPRPAKAGVTTFADYPLDELREYIDWTPFFQAWELSGTYPRIFESKRLGAEARRLFDDAQKLLDQIIAERALQARAVVGLFPANSVGDDVEVYTDESRAEVLHIFHFLRQQRELAGGRHNGSLADFVAPGDSGVRDYLGLFAVTAGIGAEELNARFRDQNDDYSEIMAKVLADRLAEALAERLHQRVRTELWGYAVSEKLDNEALIAEEYQGIRPAPGYPACPDHTEKRDLFRLLEAEKNAGIRLTENFAMHPNASVSGFYFSHPQSRYLQVGRIGLDQVKDYADRKGMSIAEVERWLAPNLAYNPTEQDITPVKS